MAEGEGPAVQVQETESSGSNLKYLSFVPAVVVKVTSYITTLYVFAKDNSGPLKPGVDSVEGIVKTVVGPVYQKIEGKPLELLTFIDGKVDGTLLFLDNVLPDTVKEAGRQAYGGTRCLVADVQKDGVWNTVRNYFEKYEPVAESFGIKAYKTALTVPLVPQAVGVARYGAVKMNDIITALKDNGLPLASHLPLLPVGYFDRITKSE